MVSRQRRRDTVFPTSDGMGGAAFAAGDFAVGPAAVRTNAATGEGYDIIPGADDGVATASPDWPFPKGDVWILRYRGSEIDDGVVAIGPPCEAGLDGWVNGESIQNTDVVIWYGAHFTHDVQHEAPGSHGHIVGPVLKPVNW